MRHSCNRSVSLLCTIFIFFRYYDKKLLPQDLFFEGKKTYMLKRGLMPVLSNKRPKKLRDALKELEVRIHFKDSVVTL